MNVRHELQTETLRTREGATVEVLNVPVEIYDAETERLELHTAEVSGHLMRLYREALAQNPAPGSTVTLEYREFPPKPTVWNPTSLAIKTAVESSGLTKTEVARRMGVKLPVLSRWMHPRYTGHGVDALERIAAALELRLELHFVNARGERVA